MPKLTKGQKLNKRWRTYARALDRFDRSIYGEYVDEHGQYHAHYQGYPQGYPWTDGYRQKTKHRNRRQRNHA